MSTSEAPIVLYHYSFSPYARRVVWYLALRGIPYSQCLQPPIMPRPDVARLGVRYRRIPIMAIGRDVYLDTRLILRKLEESHPGLPRLGAQARAEASGASAATAAEHGALERLLEVLVVDGGVFARGAELIPGDLPLTRDPAFRRDRADFFNRGAALRAGVDRAESANEVRLAAEFLETGLLADGREWILGTEGGPTLADIEAVWPFHWLAGMPGALPPDQVSAAQFPRLFAWIDRFTAAVKAAQAKAGKPPVLNGEQAESLITGSPYNEAEGEVDALDGVARAQKLAKGTKATFWPLDTGSSGKDVGRLVSLDSKEVVIETPTAAGSTVRVHAPRHGFRVGIYTEETANL